jgi:DNA-binding MarR family transcriptional regulator
VTSSDPGPLTDAAADLRYGVHRLARRLRVERSAQALSQSKISVLAQLRRNGPTSAKALADADRVQPQSLTRVFAELERDGLISRMRSASDGRQVLFGLTGDGRRALHRDLAERDAWLANALLDLNETERQVLALAARLMDRLADSAWTNADAPDAAPGPGPTSSEVRR